MNKKHVIALFYAFLREHNATEEFFIEIIETFQHDDDRKHFKNVHQVLIRTLNTYGGSCLIGAAFYWHLSSSGFDYWNRLDDYWRIVYKKYYRSWKMNGKNI